MWRCLCRAHLQGGNGHVVRRANGHIKVHKAALVQRPQHPARHSHMLTDHMETDAMGWPDFARLLMHPRPSTLTLADFVSQLLTSCSSSLEGRSASDTDAVFGNCSEQIA